MHCQWDNLANRVNSLGVHGNRASNFTVQNLTISNLYVRTSTTDNAAGGTGIQNHCDAAPWFVTNFTVSDAPSMIARRDRYWTTGSPLLGLTDHRQYYLQHQLGRPNWNRGNESVLDNLVVSHNRIYGFSKWNDTDGNCLSPQRLFAWSNRGASINGIYYYGNKIGPDFGNEYSTTAMWANGNINNVFMYKNVIVCNTNDSPSNGMLQADQGTIVYNTFLGGGRGQAITVGNPGALR